MRPGDEVITVAAGFPTTVAPILQHGAVPVFVDVQLPTYNVDVSLLEAARSPRTRAVMLAHTLGNPFDVDAVTAFCTRTASGWSRTTATQTARCGADAAPGPSAISPPSRFYPPHHMTTGEGGAVLAATPG